MVDALLEGCGAPHPRLTHRPEAAAWLPRWQWTPVCGTAGGLVPYKVCCKWSALVPYTSGGHVEWVLGGVLGPATAPPRLGCGLWFGKDVPLPRVAVAARALLQPWLCHKVVWRLDDGSQISWGRALRWLLWLCELAVLIPSTWHVGRVWRECLETGFSPSVLGWDSCTPI